MSEKPALKGDTSKRVTEALEKIKKQLDALTAKTQSSTKTNGMFSWNNRTDGREQNGSINIREVKAAVILIQILGFLISKKEEYEKAAKLLGLNTIPVFKWAGYTLEEWQNDIDQRVSIITHAEKEKELREKFNYLSQFVSEETKIEQVLKSLNFEEFEEEI